MNNLERIKNESKLNPAIFSKLYCEYLTSLIDKLDHNLISDCIELLEKARLESKNIFVIGNGGSASTASHIGNDFGLAVIKNTNSTAKSYKVISLCDNFSVISAISNDSDYENIFVDQLKVHYNTGDILLAISASGNSKNLIEAAKFVKKKNGKVLGWLGFDGGELTKYSDIPIVIKTPKGEYAPVEDIHLILNHIIVSWMQFNIKNQI